MAPKVLDMPIPLPRMIQSIKIRNLGKEWAWVFGKRMKGKSVYSDDYALSLDVRPEKEGCSGMGVGTLTYNAMATTVLTNRKTTKSNNACMLSIESMCTAILL